jgi:hypothetical protein
MLGYSFSVEVEVRFAVVLAEEAWSALSNALILEEDCHVHVGRRKLSAFARLAQLPNCTECMLERFGSVDVDCCI